jgi:hypothetical protein
MIKTYDQIWEERLQAVAARAIVAEESAQRPVSNVEAREFVASWWAELRPLLEEALERAAIEFHEGETRSST